MAEKFRTAFIALVPDAVPATHRSFIETPLYALTSVLVRDETEAIDVCTRLAKREGVTSLILCPGFTHGSVARISEAVGEGVSVNVARGDGPGNKAAFDAMAKAGWFKR